MKTTLQTITLIAALGMTTLAAWSQQNTAQPTPAGKWHDTSKDRQFHVYFNGSNDDSTKTLVSEDFEVTQTHEVCASVLGYFMEKSQLGRYDVNFKGMRTTATFTFTTQYDAEHWVQKFCTAESLLSIKKGRGTFARNY